MGDSPANFLLFSLLVLGVGVAFWKFGKYGKPIDRHPICRKCGFDLYATISLDYRCGECGARTFPPEGIRIGNRRMIAGWVNAGGFMIAAGMLGILYAAPSTFDVEITARHKPAIWLRMDAVSGNSDLRSAALTELTRRIGNSEAGADDVVPLIDRLLAIQADESQAWISSWGDLIEAAEAKGLVSSQRWQKYLDHCVSAEPESRSDMVVLQPVVRAGSWPRWSAKISGEGDFASVTLPFRADSVNLGFSNNWALWFYAHREQESLLKDPRSVGEVHITGQIELSDPATRKLLATIPVDLTVDGDVRRHMTIIGVPKPASRATTRRATATRDS